MTEPPAPAPWNTVVSGKPGSNGDYNQYITDRDGRKIAAVWGKRGEKEATALLMIAGPDLLKAAQLFRTVYTPGFPIPSEAAQALFDALNLAEGRT